MTYFIQKPNDLGHSSQISITLIKTCSHKFLLLSHTHTHARAHTRTHAHTHTTNLKDMLWLNIYQKDLLIAITICHIFSQLKAFADADIIKD